VFTFNFIQGDPKTALRDPNSCVLSESTARKIFGDRDPMNESLNGRWLTVTGIFKDLKDSHIVINMLISQVIHDSLYSTSGDYPQYFNDPSFMTYVLLPESNNPSYFEKRITDFFTSKWTAEFNFHPEGSFSLRPLKDIYFTTNLEHELNYFSHGNLKLIRILGITTILILVLAIINYINLTTARASLRAKEVGIRKVAGSSKSSLVIQFLVEAIVVTLFSFLIALTMVQLLLPAFNQLASTDVEMEFKDMPGTWIIYLVSVIVLGLISGIYPAIYLTVFKPVKYLSGEHVKGTGSVVFRRVLLTFQFTISMVLIIGVIVIFRQLAYMKTADLGFNKELVINIYSYKWQYDLSKRQVLRQQLLQNPNIRGVTFSHNIMGKEQTIANEEIEINGINKQVGGLGCDPDFFNVMGIELLDGRNFAWDRPGDYFLQGSKSLQTIWNMIVNETFVREFELEEPIGTLVKWGSRSAMIIGVVRDFNFNSQHEKILPNIYLWSQFAPFASIKIAPENIQSSLEYIEKEYKTMFSGARDFDYTFLDETYARQYLRDERIARIITNFAIVAILIACLGLFGLSSFMAVRRTKEIGIRKAMGASVQTVFLMLSREFTKWILLSVAIACPIAWYIMHRWLQGFAYRTNISWWIYALAILIAFTIAFVAVTWQSVKTARTNPVEALRYE
jgi:putative ABC transport system permease protein